MSNQSNDNDKSDDILLSQVTDPSLSPKSTPLNIFSKKLMKVKPILDVININQINNENDDEDMHEIDHDTEKGLFKQFTKRNLSNINSSYKSSRIQNIIDIAKDLNSGIKEEIAIKVLNFTDPKAADARRDNIRLEKEKKMKQIELESEYYKKSYNFRYYIRHAISGQFNVIHLIEIPKKRFSVAISSEFTDTLVERSIIFDKIEPLLQKKGHQDNITVSFVGTGAGSKSDYQNWSQSSREVERCYNESGGIFFLSLKAEKYGFAALPQYISQDMYKDRENTWTKEEKNIINEWYNLDTNAYPPHYVLKKLTSLDDTKYWNKLLPTLRKALSNINNLGDKDELHLSNSITDSEVRLALRLDQTKCLWVNRLFKGGINVNQGGNHLYKDTNDLSTSEKYDNLMKVMNKKIKSSNIIKFNNISFESYIAQNEEYNNYISSWQDEVTNVLDIELDKIICNRKYWELDGCGIGLKGCIIDEILHHCKITNKNSTLFVEHSKYIDQAIKYFNNNNRIIYIKKRNYYVNLLLQSCYSCFHYVFIVTILPRLYNLFIKFRNMLGRTFLRIAMIYLMELYFYLKLQLSNISKKIFKKKIKKDEIFIKEFNCISFCIVGISGTGKTVLMSKIADNLSKSNPSIPIICRYCGTTRESTDGYFLVQSICHQIEYIYDLKITLVTLEYKKLIEKFHYLLKKYPVYLFIDSLDQLSDSYGERSRISFLSNAQPHKNTRIIVSTLADEYDEINQKWLYFYMCDIKLRQSQVPRIEIKPCKSSLIKKINESNMLPAKLMFELLLKKNNRTLTDKQWSHALNSLNYEATPLYINLSIPIISEWTSNTSEFHLEPTVKGVINQFLNKLETDHGKYLVRFALGYITFSIGGISDNEMQDLLSMNDKTMFEVLQVTILDGVTEFPIHIWFNLRHSITDYLIETNNNCWKWNHRQLLETAVSRYSNDEKNDIYKSLGLYFSNSVDENTKKSRLIFSQPLILIGDDYNIWYSNSVVNSRRCIEGPNGLLRSNLLIKMVNEICNFEFICASIRVGVALSLVENMGLLITKMHDIDIKNQDNNNISNGFQEIFIKLKNFHRWLKQDAFVIKNTNFPSTSLTVSASNQPICSQVKVNLAKVIQKSPIETMSFDGKIYKMSFSSLLNKKNYWFRGKTLEGPTQFESLISSLYGHTQIITSCSFSNDSLKIVTASNNSSIRVWLVINGLCITKIFVDVNSAIVSNWKVSFSADDLKIYGCEGFVFKTWDAITGRLLTTSDYDSIHIPKNISLSNPILGLKYNYNNLNEYNTPNAKIKIYDTNTNQCICVIDSNISKENQPITKNTKCGQKLLLGEPGFINKMIEEEKLYEFGETLISPDGKKIAVTQFNKNNKSSNFNKWSVQIFDIYKGSTRMKAFKSKMTTLIKNSDSFLYKYSNKNEDINFDFKEEFNRLNDESILNSINGINIDMNVNILEPGTTTIDEITGRYTHILDVTIISEDIDLSIDYTEQVIYREKLYILRESIKYRENKLNYYDLQKQFIKRQHEIKDRLSRKMKLKSFPHFTSKFNNNSEINFAESDYKLSGLVYNYNGTLLSVICKNFVKILDIACNSSNGILEGHTDIVTCTVFSSDNKLIITGSNDRNIKIWNVTSFQCISTLSTPFIIWEGQITSIHISNDNTKIISGSKDRIVRLWDVNINEASKLLSNRHNDIISCVQFSIDGKLIASSSYDNSIKIWNCESGLCINTIKRHNDCITSIVFSNDGLKILSSSLDKTIILFDNDAVIYILILFFPKFIIINLHIFILYRIWLFVHL
jgi:WD40 repeat protein